MTKVLLGALVCAMLALTGVVAYSHFAVDPSVAAAPEDSGGCCSQKSSCSSCCTHELPVESAGCSECPKAKAAAAAEAAKAEVKEEASEPK